MKRAIGPLLVLAGLAAAPQARADLIFTAEPLGDKTTSPKFFFAETTARNVILKVRVENTEGATRQITGLRLSFPGTNMALLKTNYIHLLPDPDGDGDVTTPPRPHAHDLSLHAVSKQASPPLAVFNINGGALTFPPNSVTYLFAAYDCNDIQEDHSVINAQIDSPSDVTADAPVSFAGGGAIDSAGVDRVNVIATTYAWEVPAQVTAGVPFDFAVTPVDSPGNIDLDATAVVQVGVAGQNPAPNSPNGTAPVYPGQQALAGGKTTLSGTTLYGAAGTARVGLTYVSGTPAELVGTKNSPAFSISAGKPLLSFDPIGRQTAGVAFTARLTGGSDAWGNSMVGNTVQLASLNPDNPQPSLADARRPARAPEYSPASHVWQSILSTAVFTVTLFKAQPDCRLAAVDTSRPNDPGFSGAFPVVNNSTDHAHLELPDTALVDETFNGVASAHDAYNNLVDGFAGVFHATVEPSSSTDRLPADFAAPSGQASVPFTFHKWGTKTITIRDNSSPAWVASDTIYINLPYLADTIAWPSPYRPREGPLNIRFFAPSEGTARILIYSFDGAKVREWNLDTGGLGTDEVKRWIWDGRDESGNELASGLYYCVTEIGGKVGKVKFGLIQ